MTFEARRTGGKAGAIAAGADTTPIRGVEFVPVSKLPTLGISRGSPIWSRRIPWRRLRHGAEVRDRPVVPPVPFYSG